MGLLLDTHTFLWFIDDDSRLSPKATERIADPATRVLVSVINAWEITIKTGTGKLSLDRPLSELWPESIQENGFDVLDVTTAHVMALAALAPHHRDPFDRLLIAQAIAEGHDIVSADEAFDAYPIKRVW